MKFIIDFIKFALFFLVFSLIFTDIELKEAIIIAIISYSGPKLIDYFYNKIKKNKDNVIK